MVLVSVFFGVSQWIFGARTVHPNSRKYLKAKVIEKTNSFL
jgi:hypothetical protein